MHLKTEKNNENYSYTSLRSNVFENRKEQWKLFIYFVEIKFIWKQKRTMNTIHILRWGQMYLKTEKNNENYSYTSLRSNVFENRKEQ